MRILIDPGHGLYDKNGSYEFYGAFYDDFVEDIETVYLARKLFTALNEDFDVELYCTRDIFNETLGVTGSPKFYEGAWCYLKDNEQKDDNLKDDDINIRWRYANDINADLVLSLHFNASPSHKARGTQVYINKHNSQSYEFSGKFISEMISTLPTTYKTKRSVCDGMHLALVKYTNMTSILFEPLFIDNKDDQNLLNDFIYDLIVKSIIEALKAVFYIHE
jgi:N-acetylmuramoyl-L-alanine amidase